MTTEKKQANNFSSTCVCVCFVLFFKLETRFFCVPVVSLQFPFGFHASLHHHYYHYIDIHTTLTVLCII